MRLKTIWSMKGMAFPEKLRRTREWSAQKTARRLPKRVRYWTTLQEIAKATADSPNIPSSTVDEVIQKLDAPRTLT